MGNKNSHVTLKSINNIVFPQDNIVPDNPQCNYKKINYRLRGKLGRMLTELEKSKINIYLRLYHLNMRERENSTYHIVNMTYKFYNNFMLMQRLNAVLLQEKKEITKEYNKCIDSYTTKKEFLRMQKNRYANLIGLLEIEYHRNKILDDANILII